ncbi:hypothetical protein QA645_32290 [Bradyrhizobium sp. CIAT3101]|uniref:hypothetical protein n=1 Tax=Bradyrhizobium sp. CIAT3101 TaxID=439387 RepID=UPI0024B177DB|nr:hypothetical protein [Bradyrhizobium sp. CIAT3101]WFU79177.1 hypothetical protein QA645_32290 [Bradyrhizobium sp. CIAT3101]
MGFQALDHSVRENENRMGPRRSAIKASHRNFATGQQITGNRRYVFACANDAPLSRTLCQRLRALGIDTKTEHCAHGFRATFSTLCHHEEFEETKTWDGDVIELQLAHLESDSVKAVYKRHGPLALIGSRAKLMQHWADRVDSFADQRMVSANRQSLKVARLS